MEILHTPWRRAYVVGARHYEGCLFCDLLDGSRPDDARRILLRRPRACLMLNAYPYTPGHLMAVPYRHVRDLATAEPDELQDLLELAQRAERVLRRAYGCRSVHTGANLGSAAGAGVPEHLHLHIIAWPEDPLWQSCAGAPEPPETLEESWRRLAAAQDELDIGRDGS